MKYPRTLQLPTSPGVQSDDKKSSDGNPWRDNPVVVTQKLDGENTGMTRHHIHAKY